jgi:ABC-type nitrate/sulfonate/bicarbonate transport system permease component
VLVADTYPVFPLGVISLPAKPIRTAANIVGKKIPNRAIAFKLAAAHAILAAMVAEFLMGTSGLGYLFAKTKADFQTEQAFGVSAVATIISAGAFLLAGRVERRVRERYS